MARRDDALAQLVDTVLSSKKYGSFSRDFVEHVAEQEFKRQKHSKEALKAVKNKLHQVSGAYLSGREDYMAWLEELRQATAKEDEERVRETCKRIMAHHASTRERLPILESFYTTTLGDLGPLQSVLDLACGLNPLSVPWLALQPGGVYYAYDVHQPTIDFLGNALRLMHVHSEVAARDMLPPCEFPAVDVALVLKTIPCLEQVDKRAGYTLLRAIPARYLLVSFPAHSLGGREKGMVSHYEAHFHELIAGEHWQVERFVFPTELVFRIKKPLS